QVSTMFSVFRRTKKKSTPRSSRKYRTFSGRRRSFEQLEGRQLLTTFAVFSLADSGVGSLRQAIIDANAEPGADRIEFEVEGVISLTSGALPTITGAVDIDGTTTDGFLGTPTF